MSLIPIPGRYRLTLNRHHDAADVYALHLFIADDAPAGVGGIVVGVAGPLRHLAWRAGGESWLVAPHWSEGLQGLRWREDAEACTRAGREAWVEMAAVEEGGAATHDL